MTANTTHTTTNAGPLTLLQAAEVARWYDEIAPDLRRFVASRLLRTTRDATDVEDVLQETFARLIAHIGDVAALDSRERRRNYAFQAAVWVARDRYRRNARRIEATPLSTLPQDDDRVALQPLTASHDWQTHASGIEQTTAARMTLRAIWQATPPQYRELLLLLAQGYTPGEMAARLGITQQGVNMRIWRLRQVLRDAGEALA